MSMGESIVNAKDRSDNGSSTTEDPNIHVSLTSSPLSPTAVLDLIRSPHSGALVLFAGCTRDSFAGQTVKHLAYTSYVPLAVRTMTQIAKEIKAKHKLNAIAIVHRLGVVPIGEESVLIAVASAHRKAAWCAGEETLELIKEKAEIWKLEEFEGGEGVWRSNRDGQAGVKVEGGWGEVLANAGIETAQP